jgi:hypothetical protein
LPALSFDDDFAGWVTIASSRAGLERRMIRPGSGSSFTGPSADEQTAATNVGVEL